MAQNPSIYASAPSDAYSHAGRLASTPGSSFMICGWVRNPDYANSTWPYSRGNQQWLAIGGGATGGVDDWAIVAVCSNSSSATAASTDCGYNANTMVFCSNFSWVADTSYYAQATHTTAEIMGWVFVAIQVLVSAAGFTIRQWLKFGLDGEMVAAGESTVTLATCRAESYNGSWVVGDPEWIQFGGDPGMFTRLRCYSTSGTPTTAQLDVIAELDGADTTSDLAAGLYADWEYYWDTTGNTYVVTDRSGNSRDLAVEGNQVYLQGPDGPAFAAGGTSLTATVAASTAAPTGTATATSGLALTATATVSTVAPTGAAVATSGLALSATVAASTAAPTATASATSGAALSATVAASTAAPTGSAVGVSGMPLTAIAAASTVAPTATAQATLGDVLMAVVAASTAAPTAYAIATSGAELVANCNASTAAPTAVAIALVPPVAVAAASTAASTGSAVATIGATLTAVASASTAAPTAIAYATIGELVVPPSRTAVFGARRHTHILGARRLEIAI